MVTPRTSSSGRDGSACVSVPTTFAALTFATADEADLDASVAPLGIPSFPPISFFYLLRETCAACAPRTLNKSERFSEACQGYSLRIRRHHKVSATIREAARGTPNDIARYRTGRRRRRNLGQPNPAGTGTGRGGGHRLPGVRVPS